MLDLSDHYIGAKVSGAIDQVCAEAGRETSLRESSWRALVGVGTIGHGV